MLASYVRKYFWDINPQKAKPKSHPEFYIQRILEMGDKKAFEWLRTVFGTDKIKKVAKKAKLSPRSRSYWGIFLD